MLLEKKEPFFVVIDGIDGCGKTSIAKHIQDRLKNVYNKPWVSEMRAIGHGRIGAECRRRLLSDMETSPDYEAMLLPVAFQEVYHDHLIPNLNKGYSVVMDRWIASYYAYQVFGLQSDLAKKLFEEIFAQNPYFIRWPNLYFICNVDIDVANERMKNRNDNNPFDEKDRAYKERINQGYLNFTTRYFNRVVTLDCNQPLEEVLKQVDKHLLLTA